MENKYIIYSMLILLIFIMGLSAVSAGDINTTDDVLQIENDNVDTIASDTTDDDVIVEEFTQKDLTKKEINDKKTAYLDKLVYNLTDKYTYNGGEGNINITGSVLIQNILNYTQIPYKGTMGVTVTENSGYNFAPPISVTTDNNGNFSFLYPGDQTGKYRVLYHIDGTGGYWEQDVYSDILILDKNGLIPTTMYGFSFTHVSNDTYKVGTNLYDIRNDELLTNRKIVFNIEGKTYETNTGKDGMSAKVTYKFKNFGRVNISSYFAGDSEYAAYNQSCIQLLNNYYDGIDTNLTIDKVNNYFTNPDDPFLRDSDGDVVNFKYDDTLTVTGKLTDKNGNPIKNAKLYLNRFYHSGGFEDSEISIITTNDKGIFTHTCKRDNSSEINVEYSGSSNYKYSLKGVSFGIDESENNTKIYTSRPLITKIGDYVTLTSNVTGHIPGFPTFPLTYTPLTIKINGKEYTNKTDGKGVLTYNYKTDVVGINNVTISYKGNSRFLPYSSNTTFKVLGVEKTATKITVNSIGNVQKDDYVTVTGRYTAATGINLTYTPIKIVINGVTYTNKTNANGIYSYRFKASTVGTNNVTVSYAGNSRFNGDSASTTFKVSEAGKTATKITVNSLGTVQKDSYVTVTGRYTAVTGINLTYTPIKIVINGVTYTNKTNGNGIYTYTFKASKSGVNNITVSYPGNARFVGASASTTFNVANKTATKITVNTIGDVQKDSYVTVTGRYTASTGINLTYTPIKIVINGVTYTNKTNGNGIYSYTFKASNLGSNAVTVSYAGNARFIGASASTKFNVVNKTATKISVNSLGTVEKDGYVTITGRYTASTGINLTYTPIKIVINGVTYTNKTNAYGIYSYTFKASKFGTNSVTVSYAGNARFIGASASTTFEVVNKTATKITVNSIGNVKRDSYVTISGRYTASTGINLTYTPIRININGVTYTNKTNAYGIYSYTFKASTMGVNNITVSYPGNARFIGASAKTAFTVKQ